MSTIIFDDLTGTPTILATNRAKRIDMTGGVSGKLKTEAKPVDSCLFCRGHEAETPEAVYKDLDEWNVRVFPNKFPLTENHEIIVHSPFHDKDIEDFPHEQNVRIIRAMLNRVNFYTSKEKEVMIFNNRGGRAGASITHPHSQIVALKGFPGIIELEKTKAVHHYNSQNSCYWCDMIKQEIEYKKRIVFETKHFLLVVPVASRWSYELVLLPKEHRPNFEYINEVEINDFASVVKAALGAYNELFDKPDRNFWFHTQRFDPYHWHVGFIPHIKVLGALELGAGIWVSDKASPEDAAALLSEHVAKIYNSDLSSPLI